MKIVKPKFEIITDIDGDQILINIEKAARTCYKSEGKIVIVNRAGNRELYDREPISAKVLIQKLIDKGHFAMLEFGGNITVKFTCDRGVSHELVRHRLCSFAQESTRYCNYGNDKHIQFILPNWINIPEGIYTEHMDLAKGDEEWFSFMLEAEETYNFLIKHGWQPQQARSVLPNSVKTEINMSANLREWREIFRQRTSPAAHPQMRELMIPLLEKFKQKIPVIFDDL